MCPQRTAAAISCCNLGQDTSTLCTVGFQKVVSTRCFWYVHLHSAYLVLPRNLYLLLESIYTHKYRVTEAATRPKSFPLAPAALGFPFGCSVNYCWPVSLRCLQLWAPEREREWVVCGLSRKWLWQMQIKVLDATERKTESALKCIPIWHLSCWWK